MKKMQEISKMQKLKSKSGITLIALVITIKTSNTIITEMDELARELPEYEVINEIPGCGKKLTS